MELGEEEKKTFAMRETQTQPKKHRRIEFLAVQCALSSKVLWIVVFHLVYSFVECQPNQLFFLFISPCFNFFFYIRFGDKQSVSISALFSFLFISFHLLNHLTFHVVPRTCISFIFSPLSFCIIAFSTDAVVFSRFIMLF